MPQLTDQAKACKILNDIKMNTLTKASVQTAKNTKATILDTKEKKWYIFYTCPRAEKKVYEDLLQRNYEVFLPRVKILKYWNNRQKKWVDQILFPNYIFINTNYTELFNIIKFPKIVTFISCGGKPSIIPTNEIDSIKKMLSQDLPITIDNQFNIGEEVKIGNGPLAGVKGILVSHNGKSKFCIQLKEINYTIYIDIDKSLLTKTDEYLQEMELS